MRGIIQYLSFCDWPNVLEVHLYCGMWQNFLLFKAAWYPITYIRTTFSLAIHPLMNIWVASTSWLLWVILEWRWVYKCLFESLLSILLGICPRIRLLNHRVILFLIFRETSILFFHSDCPILHHHQQCTRVPTTAHTSFSVIFLIIVTILMGVRWYLLVKAHTSHRDSNPAKTRVGTWTCYLFVRITHLMSALTEAQILCVSVQKELSKSKVTGKRQIY